MLASQVVVVLSGLVSLGYAAQVLENQGVMNYEWSKKFIDDPDSHDNIQKLQVLDMASFPNALWPDCCAACTGKVYWGTPCNLFWVDTSNICYLANLKQGTTLVEAPDITLDTVREGRLLNIQKALENTNTPPP